MPDTSPEIIFWDACERERLTHSDIDEAIEEYLDQIASSEWPEIVTVKGYVRLAPSIEEYEGTRVESFLESLDEEYGDPDAYHATPPSEAMKAAELVFIKAVLAEYEPWQCEPAITKEIDAMAWVREHRPEWLEDES